MNLKTPKKSVLLGPCEALLTYGSHGRILKLCVISASLSVPERVLSEDINLVAPNANCDIVSIRQAERQSEEDLDRVDWYAFGKDHREFTGKELLPEHQEAEPERDVVTGCAIRNTDAEAREETFDEADLAEMTAVGWAKRAGSSEEGDAEQDEDALKRPQEKSEEPKDDFLETLINENPLVVQIGSILLLTIVAIALAFAVRYSIRITIGLLQRRRVCLIPCSLVAPGREIVGHMSVIGLQSFRFVPEGNDELNFFRKTLAEPTMHYFTVEVGDFSYDVFVDGIRGYYSPVAFDEKLTPKQQNEILELSTVTPQIGQLIIVPYDYKKHKKHKANRAREGGHSARKTPSAA